MNALGRTAARRCAAVGALLPLAMSSGVMRFPHLGEGGPECSLLAGPILYAETVGSAQIGQEDPARPDGRSTDSSTIEFRAGTFGAVATLHRVHAVNDTSRPATAAGAARTRTFDFHDACGTGTARLRTDEVAESEVASELPYHLDGVLLAPPTASRLAVGDGWADTLTRSDSLATGRRTSMVVRRFDVVRDSVVAGVHATVVRIESQGRVVQDEDEDRGNDAFSLVVATTSRGSAVFVHEPALMIARDDSTELRITAAAGDQRMAERIVVVARRLRWMGRP